LTAFELRIERLSRALFDGVAVHEGEPRARVDLGVFAFFADERPLRGLAALVDWRTAGALSAMLRRGFATGRAHELVLLPGRHDLPSERIVLLGLGPRGDLDLDGARRAALDMVAMALRLHPRDVLFALPSGGEERELAEALLAGVVTGLGGELPTAAEGTEVDADPPIAGTWTSADAGPPVPHADEDAEVCRWWVVADERHAGRLRRLLEGPPRAADS
jgi:hypothetical protein